MGPGRRGGERQVDDAADHRQGRAGRGVLGELIDGVSAAIQRFAVNAPADDRRPYLISPIVFPLAEPVAEG